MKAKGDLVWGWLVWGRALSPVRVGTAERSSAPACGRSNSGFATMKLKAMPVILRPLLALALLAFLPVGPSRAYAQEPTAPPPSQQTSADPAKKDNESASKHKGAVGQLIEEKRESTGEEEEDNVNLTHAGPIRWLARKTGLSVHQAHLVVLSLNFAIVVVVVFWAARKYLPAIFRDRSQLIQQALEEARAASQDANRRLADIENRLRQLDVESDKCRPPRKRKLTRRKPAF